MADMAVEMMGDCDFEMARSVEVAGIEERNY